MSGAGYKAPSKAGQATADPEKGKSASPEMRETDSPVPDTVTVRVKPKGRVAEAKACLIKVKLQLNSSRNLKVEIKAEVMQAVERLFQLVKEATAAKVSTPVTTASMAVDGSMESTVNQQRENKDMEVESDLAAKLIEHGKLLKENTEEMARLKKEMEKMEEKRPATYASVAAATTPRAVHSMVISSANTQDTSEDVINKIRTAVNARESGIQVNGLRKAREQKVVLGCQSREELAKVAEKLKSSNTTLLMEEKANRDPLVIIHNVLKINSDEDIVGALKNQNSGILGKIPEGDYRAIVKYRRKARNPLETHVVLQVSPPIWQSLTSAGKIHIDLQRVVVRDQSPLVQCSRCLGYGHGRKHCKESVDTCSHCTGPHLRSECPARKAGERPTCRNCQSAKLDQTDHNCFDGSCLIRKKWDALARARVAYC